MEDIREFFAVDIEEDAEEEDIPGDVELLKSSEENLEVYKSCLSSLENLEEDAEEEDIPGDVELLKSSEENLKVYKSCLSSLENLKEDAEEEDIPGDVELLKSIEKNLEMYTSRLSSHISLYKVPAKLRKVNEAAYTPELVSIGPIHHGKQELQGMQRYKWRYLESYLENVSISMNRLTRIAKDMENRVRECYQESFHNLDSTQFSEMIMLDGIFVIMILLENTEKTNSSRSQLTLNMWVKRDIIHDLILLENQLPFFVLQIFFRFIGETYEDLTTRITRFFCRELRYHNTVAMRCKDVPRHLVDFLRTYYLPTYSGHTGARGKIVYNRTATELQEAGLIIERAYLTFEISFQFNRLKIPRLRIDEYTETIFRNLIAFEQCQIDEWNNLTSYIIFMDSLINTAKDVDLLVDCGVIENFLADHELVASLFNNLHKETLHGDDFYFMGLCTELNNYSKDYWHQWKAKWFRAKKELRRDYLNSPWSTISVIAAVILLVLTAVQTICSIISLPG